MSSTTPHRTVSPPATDETKSQYAVEQTPVNSLPFAISNSFETSGSEQAFVKDGALAGLYVPIDTYEGKHRFDPTAQWTEAEERKIVRKVCSTTGRNFLP